MKESPAERIEKNTLIVKSDLVGLPGQPFRWAIRRVSTSNDAVPDEAFERKTFKVIFTFSKPGETLADDKKLLSAELLAGNSHLRLQSSHLDLEMEPEIRFPVLTDDVLFEIRETVNDDGFLGKLEVLSVSARDFFEAENIARKLLTRSISWYATHADIPLNIFQVDVKNLETEDFMVYRAAKPYDSVIFSQGIRVLDLKEEPAAYASIYREALNSNSHNYQFLCFFKIIDGLIIRRAKLAAEAAARGGEAYPFS